MKETGAAFWQKIARHYPSMMKRSAPLYSEICSRVRPHLSRDMNVLELACGTGQLSVPLSPYVRLWEATDYSPNMIAEAKKRVTSSRLHFSVQDAAALPYAPETFDAVVIANALHILQEPDKVMAEIRRVLKPGDGSLLPPSSTAAGGWQVFVLGVWSGLTFMFTIPGTPGNFSPICPGRTFGWWSTHCWENELCPCATPPAGGHRGVSHRAKYGDRPETTGARLVDRGCDHDVYDPAIHGERRRGLRRVPV